MDRRDLIRGACGLAALAVPGWRRGLLAQQETLPFGLTGQPVQGGALRGLAPPGTHQLTLDGKAVPIAGDGTFLIAFDRDAAPKAELAAAAADRLLASSVIAVSPRAWRIEHVPVNLRPPAVPSAEFAQRRAAELAQIRAARAAGHFSDGWRQAMIWPAVGRLSGRFGAQRVYNGTPGAYHSGTDIATGTAGTPFVAPADGVVTLAAEAAFSLEGRLLMLDHGMGLNSAFLHCAELAVRAGEAVRQGQVIGRIGATGRATGPHLHWSMMWRDSRLDAELFVPRMPQPSKG